MICIGMMFIVNITMVIQIQKPHYYKKQLQKYKKDFNVKKRRPFGRFFISECKPTWDLISGIVSHSFNVIPRKPKGRPWESTMTVECSKNKSCFYGLPRSLPPLRGPLPCGGGIINKPPISRSSSMRNYRDKATLNGRFFATPCSTVCGVLLGPVTQVCR